MHSVDTSSAAQQLHDLPSSIETTTATLVTDTQRWMDIAMRNLFNRRFKS